MEQARTVGSYDNILDVGVADRNTLIGIGNGEITSILLPAYAVADLYDIGAIERAVFGGQCDDMLVKDLREKYARRYERVAFSYTAYLGDLPERRFKGNPKWSVTTGVGGGFILTWNREDA